MWAGRKETKQKSEGLLPGRATIGPLLLMTITPAAVFWMWYTMRHKGGSIEASLGMLYEKGLVDGYMEMLPRWETIWPQWKLLGSYALIELLFMRFLPGPIVKGPVSPSGHVPEYKANGPLALFASIVVYLAAVTLGYHRAGSIYENFGSIIGFLCLFSLAFCGFLYVKGHVAPSKGDHGSSGNPVIDYYWGMELYPRIFGWDVKMFTNCRFGMMGWALLLLDYTLWQYKRYGFVADTMIVSVALQLIYITKFFWWEMGYMSTIDIMHDRAGYYLCWGCMVWVPTLYASPGYYLASHPDDIGFGRALLIFIAGVVSIWINYDCDRQRQDFRKSGGKNLVWGRKPKYIVAEYTTSDGEVRKSLLLTSGWWGLARHFHYVPEIAAAFFWTLPAMFKNAFPYTYVIYLTILLLDRAYRDDARCRSKYTKYWDEYCRRVPSRLIPYLY